MSAGKLTEAEIRRIGRAIHGEICADAHASFSCREAAEAAAPAVEAILAEREASPRAEVDAVVRAREGGDFTPLLPKLRRIARGGDGA